MFDRVFKSSLENRNLIILVIVLVAVALILTVAYIVIGRPQETETADDGSMVPPLPQIDEAGITSVPLNQSPAPGMYAGTGIEDVGRTPDTSLNRTPISPPAKGCFIHVDKSDHILTLYKDGKPHKRYPVTVGAGEGDKTRVGDMRTPEGNFYIARIENSSERTFDEGSGPEHAYGPWFLRLETGREQTFSGEGWTGIGIHGTSRPQVLGRHASHGCIRLLNDHITELKSIIEPAVNAKERIYVVVVP
jgi:lipoprotein-anchoring transpeptidase ErfK/SrfK